MKTILAFLLVTATFAHATARGLFTIKQPIFLMGSDLDSEIQIVDVPVVMVMGLSESVFSAICLPFVPPAFGSAKSSDVNLASRYGITVSAVKSDAADLTVTIDASKARVPENFPFTIDQVIDAVATCVKLMHRSKPPEQFKFTLNITRPPR